MMQAAEFARQNPALAGAGAVVATGVVIVAAPAAVAGTVLTATGFGANGVAAGLFSLKCKEVT